MMKRPLIAEIKTAEELLKWYWLKAELVAHCQAINVNYSGKKMEILARISAALDFKQVERKKTLKTTSKFDWHSEPLTLQTRITDSYKNTQNVRRFFQENTEKSFRFSIDFMAWMKANVGKTLQEAAREWTRLQEERKRKDFKTQIPSGNQYNQYLRDFFADNPEKTMQEARRCWQLKRALPLGLHQYERADLALAEVEKS